MFFLALELWPHARYSKKKIIEITHLVFQPGGHFVAAKVRRTVPLVQVMVFIGGVLGGVPTPESLGSLAVARALGETPAEFFV